MAHFRPISLRRLLLGNFGELEHARVFLGQFLVSRQNGCRSLLLYQRAPTPGGPFRWLGGGYFSGRERRVEILHERPQHGNALDHDGARDFGRVPDLRHGIAPHVPDVVNMHEGRGLPPGPHRSDDGNAFHKSV